MPYMNGQYYQPTSKKQRKLIDQVNLVEKQYKGLTPPMWENLSLEEVIKDMATAFPRLGGSKHQYRGGHYDPPKSPRNLKRRHPMSAKTFVNIKFEKQFPKVKTDLVSFGIDFGYDDPHVAVRRIGMHPEGLDD
jgi:hypothetical protein